MVQMTQDEIKAASGLIGVEVSEEMVQHLLNSWQALEDSDWVWETVDRVVRHVRYYLAGERPMSAYTSLVARQILYNNQVDPSESDVLLGVICVPTISVQAALCLVMLMVERTVHDRGFTVTCWEVGRTCGMMTPRICRAGCKGCPYCKVDCECTPLREVP